MYDVTTLNVFGPNWLTIHTSFQLLRHRGIIPVDTRLAYHRITIVLGITTDIYQEMILHHQHHCGAQVHHLILSLSVLFINIIAIIITHLSYDDCKNICTLSYHNQIGSMTHLPLFKVRSWSNSMRYMSLYIFQQTHGQMFYIWKIQ